MLDTKHEIPSFSYQERESRIRSERMNMADPTFIQMSLTKLQKFNLAAFKQDIYWASITPFYTGTLFLCNPSKFSQCCFYHLSYCRKPEDTATEERKIKRSAALQLSLALLFHLFLEGTI